MMKEGLQNRYKRRGLQNWEVRRGTKSPSIYDMSARARNSKIHLKKTRNLYKSESLTKNGGENYYFWGYFVIGENCHKEDRLFQCLK